MTSHPSVGTRTLGRDGLVVSELGLGCMGMSQVYGEADRDESVLHATATGHPFGLDGRGRPVHTRFLHIFDFEDGLISRESAWIDLAAVQEQLG